MPERRRAMPKPPKLSFPAPYDRPVLDRSACICPKNATRPSHDALGKRLISYIYDLAYQLVPDW